MSSGGCVLDAGASLQRWTWLRALVLGSVAALLLSVVGIGAARADVASNSAAAQAMFDEAKSLVSNGHYVEACPKFEESERLDPALGTLLNLADCYERLGRFASAWGKYIEAAAVAEQAHRADRLAAARRRAAAVASHVGRVTIHVLGPVPPELEIRRDGQVVGPAQWDVAIPVDPGIHTVSASLGHRGVSWSTNVTIGPLAVVTEVIIPALIDEANPPATGTDPYDAQPPARPADGTPAAVPAATPTKNESLDVDGRAIRRTAPPAAFHFGAQRAFALMMAAGGVAGLSVGALYGMTTLSKRREAERRCPGTPCEDSTVPGLFASARQARTYAAIAIAAGAGGLLGGAVLWITGGSSGSDDRGRVAVTHVGLWPASISVSGSF